MTAMSSASAEQERCSAASRAAVICLRHAASRWGQAPMSPRSWCGLAVANRLVECLPSDVWSEEERAQQRFMAVAACLIPTDGEPSPAAIHSRVRQLGYGRRVVVRALLEAGVGFGAVEEGRRALVRCVVSAWAFFPRVRAASRDVLRAGIEAGRPDVVGAQLRLALCGEAAGPEVRPRHVAELLRSSPRRLCDLVGGLQPDFAAEALFAACTSGESEIVEALLAADADPSAAMRFPQDLLETDYRLGPQELTPLMVAAFHGHTSVVQLFLEARAGPDAQSRGTQRTALHYGCGRGQLGVVRLLLDSGARQRDTQPQGRLQEGSAPLDFARAAVARHERGQQGLSEAAAVVLELQGRR